MEYPPRTAEELKLLIDNKIREIDLRIESLEYLLNSEKNYKKQIIGLKQEKILYETDKDFEPEMENKKKYKMISLKTIKLSGEEMALAEKLINSGVVEDFNDLIKKSLDLMKEKILQKK